MMGGLQLKHLSAIIILLLFISGCSSEEAVNALKKENEELRDERDRLIEEGNKQQETQALAQKNEEELNSVLSSLRGEMERQKETIHTYQESIRLLQRNSSVIEDTLSIFSPEYVQKGDKIAGLVVSAVTVEKGKEDPGYRVDFTGELALKGYIIPNLVGGSKYSLMVENHLEKLPHSLREFEQNKVFFNIKNSEDAEKALRGKVENLSENDTVGIEAVFKNVSYVYIPQSEVANTVEFVGLASAE